MKENVIKDKTFAFGKRIVRMCAYLEETKKEFVISKQLKRSGTAVGAIVREAEHAESTKDFIHKLSMALKEANESEYWLHMIKEGNYISQIEFESIWNDCIEIIKILVAIIKTSKGGNGDKAP
ncbi:MAG: four helix bundle protein [Bacteroidetes bacterium]|nr:four helix bundle protein [Bacteroidota bacterium]